MTGWEGYNLRQRGRPRSISGGFASRPSVAPPAPVRNNVQPSIPSPVPDSSYAGGGVDSGGAAPAPVTPAAPIIPTRGRS